MSREFAAGRVQQSMVSAMNKVLFIFLDDGG